jgi:hypothetical protein
MHSGNMCDMYMCRLRHINDSVLASLKMEGIRLLILYVSRLTNLPHIVIKLVMYALIAVTTHTC